mmetsp:Transcript_46879/g.69708  ORF Transcript_46879/g.69708 Transcript_46879/m.69708 type:complete len:279 (-) Transcript_46879:398-1234(-)
MLSIFKKASSPSSAAAKKELTSTKNELAPTSAENELLREKTAAKQALLMNDKLQRENRQLRQELGDAYARIRELKSTLLVFISKAEEGASNGSIEVQSVMDLSTTSSTTTVPTGSSLANEERLKQLGRDEEKLAKWRTGLATPRKQQPTTSATNRSKQGVVVPFDEHRNDPAGVLNRSHSTVLSTIVASDSSDASSFDGLFSSSVSDISESDVSERQPPPDDVLSSLRRRQPPPPHYDPNSVSAYTSVYFSRSAASGASSTNSEFSSAVSVGDSIGEI